MKSLTVGDPFDENTDYGAIINQNNLIVFMKRFKMLLKWCNIDDWWTSIKTPWFLLRTNGIDSVRKDDNVFKDEIFGPVLAITTYRDFEQVIEDANDTNAGLSSYIFSENLTEVMTATERLKFGEVYANCEAEEVVNGYHAGWRESGLGGADGIHGFEEYYNTTVSYIRY